MICPHCGSYTRVLKTEKVFSSVLRKRECTTCWKIFTTVEKAQGQYEEYITEDLKCCGNCGLRYRCPDMKKVDKNCERWEWDHLKAYNRGESCD